MNSIKTNPKLLLRHTNAMKKCEELWKCLSSPKKREAIVDYIKCNLKRPVQTRWNSLYDALCQIVSLKDLINTVGMKIIVGSSTYLETDDFSYIEEYLVINKPLARAIDELQAENNCHYGYLLPTLIAVRRKWLLLLESES